MTELLHRTSVDDELLSLVPSELAGFLRLDPAAGLPDPDAMLAGAGSPAGPLLVGTAAGTVPAELLVQMLLVLPVPPHRIRRVLSVLRRNARDVDPALLMDALVHLEHRLADVPFPLTSALQASWWLPRSLPAVVDGTVLLFEATGSAPAAPSAAWPVIAASERAGVRSLLDLERGGNGVAPDHEVDLAALRSSAQALHLLGANASACRLLAFLDLVDPDPSGVERRLLRGLLIRRDAAVPPERVIPLWQRTF